MPSDFFKNLLADFTSANIWNNWAFYILVVLGSVLFTYFRGLISSYTNKRGEILATKADWAELLRQIVATESAKTDISTTASDAAALRAVMREKMETFIETAFSIELWLEKSRNDEMLRGIITESNSSPLPKLSTFQMIYFPDLAPEMTELKARFKAMQSWNSSVLFDLAEAKKNTSTPSTSHSDIMEFEKTHLASFRQAVLDLNNAVLYRYAKQAGLSLNNSTSI